LAARGKTTRDTAWQTTKMDSAEKKNIRKAYLTTLTPKCLRIFIQPHFTDIGLDYNGAFVCTCIVIIIIVVDVS